MALLVLRLWVVEPNLVGHPHSLLAPSLQEWRFNSCTEVTKQVGAGTPSSAEPTSTTGASSMLSECRHFSVR